MKTILTGDRPTGPLHLGHFVGSLMKRVELQDKYDLFIMIADAQGLTDNFENPDKLSDNIYEVALDYLACGIDPSKAKIFVQSHIPELFELTMYYLNLVTVARLERNPTVKIEIRNKDYERDIPAGFLVYPVSQAADITAFKAELVPVGEDQLPMIEQTNEIVRKLNRIAKKQVLVETSAVLSTIKRLPGIDGKEKMSKSLGNTINLGATPKEISKAVKMMYTDPNHLRIEDPGQVEGNTVFMFLDYFHPDKDFVESLKAHYRAGGLGDGTVKKHLEEVLQETLRPIRERRLSYAQDPQFIKDLLRKGRELASERACATVKEVREVFRMGY